MTTYRHTWRPRSLDHLSIDRRNRLPTPSRLYQFLYLRFVGNAKLVVAGQRPLCRKILLFHPLGNNPKLSWTFESSRVFSILYRQTRIPVVPRSLTRAHIRDQRSS